jgi:hypothetical protein
VIDCQEVDEPIVHTAAMQVRQASRLGGKPEEPHNSFGAEMSRVVG